MRLSRGSFAFAVLPLLATPTRAWLNQRDASYRATALSSTEKTEWVSVLPESGRHVATLGVGCFLAAAVFASPALADAGKFSYDPNLGGPETWSSLQVEGNQCSGKKQSPIAIRPTGCNIGANYEMKVWKDFVVVIGCRDISLHLHTSQLTHLSILTFAARNVHNKRSGLCSWSKWAEGVFSEAMFWKYSTNPLRRGSI